MNNAKVDEVLSGIAVLLRQRGFGAIRHPADQPLPMSRPTTVSLQHARWMVAEALTFPAGEGRKEDALAWLHSRCALGSRRHDHRSSQASEHADGGKMKLTDVELRRLRLEEDFPETFGAWLKRDRFNSIIDELLAARRVVEVTKRELRAATIDAYDFEETNAAIDEYDKTVSR